MGYDGAVDGGFSRRLVGSRKFAEYSRLYQHHSQEFRAVAAVELIKIDLRRRFQAGQGKLLEEYAQELPEVLHDGEPPSDLIYEEFHVRKQQAKILIPASILPDSPKTQLPCNVCWRMWNMIVRHRWRLIYHPAIFRLAINSMSSCSLPNSGRRICERLSRTPAINAAHGGTKNFRQTGNEAETLAQLDHPIHYSWCTTSGAC